MIKTTVPILLLGAIALGIWTNYESWIPSSAAAAEKTANQEKAVFRVTGMTCGGCEVAVKMAVNSLEGIHKVEASYKDNKAVVTYEPSKVKPEEIKAAIETLGYEAELEKEKQEE